MKLSIKRVIQLSEMAYEARCKADQLLRGAYNLRKINNMHGASWLSARAMRFERIYAQASSLLERFA